MLVTSADLLKQTVARLRAGVTKNPREYEWRRQQLLALRAMLEENTDAIVEALWKDLHKSKFECVATEQGIVLAEIDVALKNLKRWMRPRRVFTPLLAQPGRSKIVHDPYGLTLIIGAWNYPIQLLLAPLVPAIAGGNGAIIKPSEIAEHTSHLIAKLVPKYLDPELFAVVEGAVEETTILLEQKFDKIFFTGSPPVGKIVMAAAAPHLTPVTLELGGKSPAVIRPDADLMVSARRIVWGKFMNAGQTCVAPDYVLIHPEVREKFLASLKQVLGEFYGSDIKKNADYCRIINQRNFDRLRGLLQGLNVLHGGGADRESLFIEPTLVEAFPDSKIMQEEIFGPILPLLTIGDEAEVLRFINERPKPLALYVFTQDRKTAEKFAVSTSSGGMVVNDVVLHLPISGLPFGGVGGSGMGNYHGEFGFKTFTHAKALLHRSVHFDVPVRYPPYSERKAKLLQWLLR